LGEGMQRATSTVGGLAALTKKSKNHLILRLCRFKYKQIKKD